jgi:hypothetical protein
MSPTGMSPRNAGSNNNKNVINYSSDGDEPAQITNQDTK